MGKFPRIQVTVRNEFLSASIALVPKIGTHVIHQILTSQISSKQPIKTKLNLFLTEVRVTATSKWGRVGRKEAKPLYLSGLNAKNFLGLCEDDIIV